MLQAANVRKVFKSAQQRYFALDGLNVEIADRESYCLTCPYRKPKPADQRARIG